MPAGPCSHDSRGDPACLSQVPGLPGSWAWAAPLPLSLVPSGGASWDGAHPTPCGHTCTDPVSHQEGGEALLVGVPGAHGALRWDTGAQGETRALWERTGLGVGGPCSDLTEAVGGSLSPHPASVSPPYTRGRGAVNSKPDKCEEPGCLQRPELPLPCDSAELGVKKEVQE